MASVALRRRCASAPSDRLDGGGGPDHGEAYGVLAEAGVDDMGAACEVEGRANEVLMLREGGAGWVAVEARA